MFTDYETIVDHNTATEHTYVLRDPVRDRYTVVQLLHRQGQLRGVIRPGTPDRRLFAGASSEGVRYVARWTPTEKEARAWYRHVLDLDGSRAARYEQALAEYDTLGSRLREARQDVGLSQAQLAAAVDVPQQSISKWERGQDPSTKALVRLADALGVSIDWLAGRG